MSKKKVLITGGAGYLGGALTSLLMTREDLEIRVYDSLLYEESYRKEVPFVYGDILDSDRLKEHLNWADYVIWLAAIVGDGACKLDEVLTMQVNQESVKWLTQNFSGRIVFISTCSVYGAQDDLNLTESSSVAPLSLYAYTKLQSEEHLKNSNALIFRLGTLFGVSDTYSRVRMDLVVNTMTARAHATGRISVFGGEQYRPLMHVRDVAQVIASNFDGEHTGIYNIANENIKIHDLALRIKQFFDKVEIQVTNMPFEDTRNYVVSSDKAKKELIFDPQLSVDFGIEQIKELLQNRRIKDLHAMRYSNQLFLKDVLPQQSTTHKWKSLNS